MDTTTLTPMPRRQRKAPPLLSAPSETFIGGTAKVRLNVARLPDHDLIQTCKAHAVAMHDNPLFPDLQPSEEDYQTLIEDFAGSVSYLANLKLLLDAAYMERDTKRAALETGTRARISYVQLKGKGAATVIASGGFNTQRAPHRIGYLDSPLGLFVALGDVPGTMEVTWDAVKKTRGYLLQHAEGAQGDANPNWTLEVLGKPKKIFTDMKLGTSYLFRVATLGGKGGQSAWSPVVVRVAG
jgi:hypothetical protein